MVRRWSDSAVFIGGTATCLVDPRGSLAPSSAHHTVAVPQPAGSVLSANDEVKMPKRIITSRFQRVTRSAVAIGLAVLLTCACAGIRVHAQAPLTVQPSFAGKQAISALEPLVLRLNRPLAATEGRLAVFIGLTDMTALFTATPNGLSYAPKSLPLPPGETPVTIHLVSPADEWKELAQFTLHVAGNPVSTTTEASASEKATARRFGFDKFGVDPSVTVGVVAQPRETHFPASNRPERPTYTDLTLQGSLQTEMVRGLFNSQTNFDLVGASFQGQALRFDTLGNAAPNIDLSNYLMQFQFKQAKVTLGHVSFGANRFLMDSFSSRGITLNVPINNRWDVAVAAMNGSRIVGWSNFFGLDRRKHQHVSGTIGYEFLPERRGGLRLEASMLQGSLQPISNFNQGNITDAEQSKGFGFRLQASNKSQRFRTDAGFARSRFNNPDDPTLTQGLTVAPARAATRNAHYVEVGYDVLRDWKLTENKKANLTVNVRHEQVAPLFRSVAADAQANKFQNQFEMIGSVGEFTLTVSNFRFNDNLDNIPSILKAFTRRQNLIFGAPLASLSRNPEKPWWWLPTLSYSFDRTHQFATELPSNAGFKLAQLPDQISTNHSFSSEWQTDHWSFAYRYNQSFQNNRVEGQPLPIPSTLGNVVHGVTLGLKITRSLDLNFELSRENLQSLDSNANKDKERNDHTLRYGGGLNWRITQYSALVLNVFDTVGSSRSDLSLSSMQRNLGYDAQWSHSFAREQGRLSKVKAQFYIRYADQSARSLDFLFGINSLTRSQTLNTGLNFTFF
jgi:hypothetical protein